MGKNGGNDDLQSRVAACFEHTFGETAIADRVADVERQTSKLANHLDQRSLREATGDLLASALGLEVKTTTVRRLIANDDPSAGEALPRGVLQYITQNGIYQSDDSRVRLAGRSRKGRIAVMIGSFDPPTTAQVRLVETLLSAAYESVRILPAARVRAGMVIEHADPVHRASLIDLTFGGRPRVEIDFRGLEDELAVAPATLHQACDSRTELWFVVPDEAVAGRENKNDLRNAWQNGEQLWQEAGFIIVTDPGKSLDVQQLPPRHQVVPLEDIRQPVELRQQLARGVVVPKCIPKVAAGYIRRHRLFQSPKWSVTGC